MQPRREPLLWLQCLALGAIPLELLLIRLVLAGADPGPVPGVERVLIWGVGVLAPAVALWRRPADWGSLLLVRQPLASRTSEQLRISAAHSGLNSRVTVAIAAVSLLPMLWWLDDSAVLASEFSPVSDQSRLVTLLLVSPLSALIIWQLQQLVQAAQLLLGSAATIAPADSAFRADAVATQRTSLGLQLLNLPALEWPEPARETIKQEPDKAIGVEDTESEPDESSAVNPVTAAGPDEADPETAPEPVVAEAQAEDIDPTSDQDADEAFDLEDNAPEQDDSTEDVNAADISADNEEPDDESSAVNPVTAAGPDEADPETAPEPVVAEAQAEDIDPTSDQDADEAFDLEDNAPEQDVSTEDVSAADISADNEEPHDKSSSINTATAEESDDVEPEALEPVDAEAQDDISEDHDSEDISAVDADESTVAAAASVPVEPEQPGEEQESTALDAEIGEVDRVASGSTEKHREQTESSGGKESEPDEPPEPTPGSL